MNDAQQVVQSAPLDQRAQDASVIAKGAGVNFLGTLAKVIKSTTFVILARLFGAEVFGLYALAWSVIDLLSKLGSFGLDRAILKFAVQHRNDRNDQAIRQTLGRSMLISLGTSLAVSFFIYGAAPYIATHIFYKPALASMLRILAWAIPFMTLSTMCLAGMKSLKIMKYDAYVKSVAEPLILCAAACVLFLLGWRYTGIAAGHLCAVIGGGAVALVVFNRFFSIRACAAEIRGIRLWSGLTSFSLPVMGYELVYILMMRLDALMVGYFLPAVQVGIYAVAIEIALTTKKVRQWFDPIFAPIISELSHLNEHERLSENFALVTRWVLTLSLPFFFSMILFGEDVLLLFGSAFAAGAASLVLLSLSQVLYASIGSGDNLLIMSGHPYLNLLNTTVVLVINFVLGLMLIPRYGMAGAAMGTFAAFGLLSIIRTIEVYRVLGIHPFRRALWKPCAASLIAFGAGYVLSGWLPEQGVWKAIPQGVLYLVAYGVLLYYFGLEEADRVVISKIRTRIRKIRTPEKQHLPLSA